MNAPTMALTIPRPWAWMIAEGIRRDWLVGTDPTHLVGGLVALHSATAGDAEGWRRFDAWTEHEKKREEVARLCPHSAIVGVAMVEGAERRGAEWRIQFGLSMSIDAIGPIRVDEVEIWALPARRREQLRRVFVRPAGHRALAVVQPSPPASWSEA
jgi:hypothetical protein